MAGPDPGIVFTSPDAWRGARPTPAHEPPALRQRAAGGLF